MGMAQHDWNPFMFFDVFADPTDDQPFKCESPGCPKDNGPIRRYGEICHANSHFLQQIITMPVFIGKNVCFHKENHEHTSRMI